MSAPLSRAQRVVGHLLPREQPTQALCSQQVAFTKKPVKVVVTGAAGNIAYAILFM